VAAAARFAESAVTSPPAARPFDEAESPAAPPLEQAARAANAAIVSSGRAGGRVIGREISTSDVGY
jgi:hypothetical protein